MAIPHEVLLSRLDDPGAKTKIAARFGGYIRDRLREVSFLEQILPPENVDRSQCQVSPNHDSLVKIEFVEPQSRAMTVTFRGEPTARFIRGEKVEIPFYTIMSEMFQKPEQEFLAYTYPIGKVIEQNSVRDLGEIQDREALIHIEASVQALQTEANGGSVTTLNASALAGGTPPVESSVLKGEMARAATTDDGVVYPIQKPDLVKLFNLLDGNRLETDLILFTTTDHNNILQWTVEDQGDKVQSETVVQGFKYNMILGKKYVRTVKTDILRPGNVYSFTSPDFLGKFYVLNNVKFYIDKVINIVKFVSWKDIGMSFINVAAMRKLELYSGDATTSDADSILTSVTPKDESDLGAANNRVSNGTFFPSVVHF